MLLKGDVVRAAIRAAAEERSEPVHIILPGPLGDPDADYWTMYCGLVVRAFDDGTLDPNVDFYEATHGYNANCPECLRIWERQHG